MSENTMLTAPLPQEMAFFSWHLGTDLFNGDTQFGELFGLDHAGLCRGLPILSIVQKIVDADRPRIAEAIHKAIVTGEPYREAYRIEHAHGRFYDVIAVGRCMRDAGGTPSIYSGTVINTAGVDLSFDADPLVGHCRKALTIARARGHELSARYISSALGSLSFPGIPD